MENYDVYGPDNLAGKRILITGGTTGIGRATAIMLAHLGAHVLIFGRHEKELEDTLASVRGKNFKLQGFTADVSKKQDIQLIFEQVDQKLGGLDVLVNNAALAAQSVTEKNYDDWQYVVDTNIMGYLACSHEAIARMKQDGGHIVHVGSMSAEVREEGSAVYVATKSAIEGFTVSLRKEVNKMGIKVTLIEPGATATDMQGSNAEKLARKTEELEMLKAEDIAAAIVYALSQPKRCDVVSMQIRPHLQLI